MLLIYYYLTLAKTWTRISTTEYILRGGLPPPTRRYGHTMVSFDHYLYVFGGSADYTLPNDLHRFDLNTRTWSVVLPSADSKVPSGRLFHAAVAINDVMYIFGGTNNKNVRSSELFRFKFDHYPPCTLHDDFGRILEKQLITDLDFVLISEDQQVSKMSAHISFVAARSPYLKNEIRLAKEKQMSIKAQDEEADENDNKKLEIIIKNVNPFAFEIVLNFIYTDKIDPWKKGIDPASNQMVSSNNCFISLIIFFPLVLGSNNDGCLHSFSVI